MAAPGPSRSGPRTRDFTFDALYPQMPIFDELPLTTAEKALRRQLAEANHANADLYNKIADRDAKIDALETQYKAFRDLNGRLVQRLSDNDARIKERTDAHDEAVAELDTQRREHQSLKTQLTAKTRKAADLERYATVPDSQLADLKAAYIKLESDYHEIDADKAVLHSQVDRLEDALKEANMKIEQNSEAHRYLDMITEQFAPIFASLGEDLTPDNFARRVHNLEAQQQLPRRIGSEISLVNDRSRSRSTRKTIADELKDLPSDEDTQDTTPESIIEPEDTILIQTAPVQLALPLQSQSESVTRSKLQTTETGTQTRPLSPPVDTAAAAKLKKAEDRIDELVHEGVISATRIEKLEKQLKNKDNKPTVIVRPVEPTIITTTKSVKHENFIQFFRAAPWYIQVPYILLMLFCIIISIAAYRERRLWLDANDTTYAYARSILGRNSHDWGLDYVQFWIEDKIGYDRTLCG